MTCRARSCEVQQAKNQSKTRECRSSEPTQEVDSHWTTPSRITWNIVSVGQHSIVRQGELRRRRVGETAYVSLSLSLLLSPFAVRQGESTWHRMTIPSHPILYYTILFAAFRVGSRLPFLSSSHVSSLVMHRQEQLTDVTDGSRQHSYRKGNSPCCFSPRTVYIVDRERHVKTVHTR